GAGRLAALRGLGSRTLGALGLPSGDGRLALLLLGDALLLLRLGAHLLLAGDAVLAGALLRRPQEGAIPGREAGSDDADEHRDADDRDDVRRVGGREALLRAARRED